MKGNLIDRMMKGSVVPAEDVPNIPSEVVFEDFESGISGWDTDTIDPYEGLRHIIVPSKSIVAAGYFGAEIDLSSAPTFRLAIRVKDSGLGGYLRAKFTNVGGRTNEMDIPFGSVPFDTWSLLSVPWSDPDPSRRDEVRFIQFESEVATPGPEVYIDKLYYET